MEQNKKGKDPASLPHAIESLSSLSREIGDQLPVLFLDYDGTLSPIVKNPDEAILAEKTKDRLQELAKLVPVAVVSGRDRADVKAKVGLEKLVYAGSHGFDITGPNGLNMQYEGGERAVPALDAAEKSLNEKLGNIEGAWVERKKYAIAVHYRNVAEEKEETVKTAVEEVLEQQKGLKKGGGKKIMELKPNIDWHKGRATTWLLDALSLNDGQHIPMFIGDDVTDEDALEAISGKGIGILVGTHGQTTAASYRLEDTEEVADFLEKLQQLLESRSNN